MDSIKNALSNTGRVVAIITGLIFIVAAAFIIICNKPLTSAVTESSLFIRGNTAYSHGEFDDAEVYYRLLLKKNPRSSGAKFNLANACYRQGRFAEASIYYRQVLKDTGSELKVQSWNNLGNTYYRLGNLKASKECYKAALVYTDGSDSLVRKNFLFVADLMNRQNILFANYKKEKKPAEKKNNEVQHDKDDDEKGSRKLAGAAAANTMADKTIYDLFRKVELNENALRAKISKTRSNNRSSTPTNGPDY